MYFSPLSSLSEDFVDCRFCLALIVVVLCIMWLLLRTWDGVLHSWRNVSHGVGWSTEKANSVSSYRFTDVAYLIVIYWFIKHVSVSGLCHHSPRKIPIHSCLWLTWSQGFPFAITLFLSDWFILVGHSGPFINKKDHYAPWLFSWWRFKLSVEKKLIAKTYKAFSGLY